jgi:hypothetical protein
MMQAFIYSMKAKRDDHMLERMAFVAPSLRYAEAAVDEYRRAILEDIVFTLVDTVPVAMSVHRG